jgi:cytochrome b6-f complex iron-sulfur subunit
MDRGKFIRTCCYSAIGMPLLASTLQGCSGIHYAEATSEKSMLILPKNEFLVNLEATEKSRKFVLINVDFSQFPICVYRTGSDKYVASLMQCTHNVCELTVGGGIYTCPCHGSEFSTEGEVLEGPALKNLKTFLLEVDNENIYIHTA